MFGVSSLITCSLHVGLVLQLGVLPFGFHVNAKCIPCSPTNPIGLVCMYVCMYVVSRKNLWTFNSPQFSHFYAHFYYIEHGAPGINHGWIIFGYIIEKGITAITYMRFEADSLNISGAKVALHFCGIC